jgi:hypothetical protein
VASDDGFLSRWSRRKAQVARGEPVPEAVAPPPAAEAAVAVQPAAIDPASPGASQALPPTPGAAPEAAVNPPAPTMADVDLLTHESDYARFVARNVDTDVKNAALKKLFTDPHFNVMDGLDTYIDDYGIPDPLPAGMLRQMAQSHFLGLFADEAKAPGAEGELAASAPATSGDPAALDASVDAEHDAGLEGAVDPVGPDANAMTPDDADPTPLADALKASQPESCDEAFSRAVPAWAAGPSSQATPGPEAPASPTPFQPAIPAQPLPDEDPDLRLQPDDDARRAVLEPRAREDARRRS